MANGNYLKMVQEKISLLSKGKKKSIKKIKQNINQKKIRIQAILMKVSKIQILHLKNKIIKFIKKIEKMRIN